MRRGPVGPLAPGTAERRRDGVDPAFEALRRVREFAEAALPAGADALLAAGVDESLDVAATLRDMDLDEECILAALLRPLAAAGAAAPARIAARFGAGVARLVEGLRRMEALRDLPPPGPGAARSAEQADRLRKLLLAVVEDVRVVIVYLALALQRMRGMRRLPAEERRRLARESERVFAPLASRLGIWQFKWELEDLAFRELDPDTYKDLARRINERRVDRERYVARMVARLAAELRRAGVDAEVTGRPKHIHGIWRKMQRKSLHLDQVFDLRALRVIVEGVAQCYTALGVVHGLWKHLPREFDDYVNNPKPNGYRSLHTAVIGPEGRTLEVQIRTREMHEQAELGVAAHWRYKEGRPREGRGRRDRDLDQRVAWLRRLLEARDDDEQGGLLEQWSSELAAERVYVLTPRGDIVDLPAGATPLDFAYHIHTEVGHRCRGAKVDGSMVPLTYRLVSGDQVEILTTRTARPSRDWLNPNLGYLRTPRARAKARLWFRQQDYERNFADGQAIWERELKRLGIASAPHDELLARFNVTRFDDLLAALGRGDATVGQLASALAPHVPARERPPPPARAPRRRAGGGGDVRISGVGNLLTQMAGCCKPLPSDPIVGYITKGRGVSVHRRDCANVLRLAGGERGRLIEVSWAETPTHAYPVDLVVAAWDRRGLLRDVTSVVSNAGVNIVALDSSTDDTHGTVEMRLTVEVDGLDQMARVLDRLSQLANVTDARRAG